MKGEVDQPRAPRRVPSVVGVTVQPAWLSVEDAIAYSGIRRTAMFDLAGAASNAGMDGGETAALLRPYLGHAPGPDFLRAFDAMRCASLLREAMWAMVSDLHLAAPGADYRAYAHENLDRLSAALSDFTQKYGAP